ncbi:MAG: isochorismate synthase [Anaerolineae bacterium]|nr:isochorismate synthase [Anaerolineae bacterium]MDW8170872.1 isochorismate synthase [Anaerolineae bacterium]
MSYIRDHYGRLISLSLPCPDLSLLDFLRQHQDQARFYWQDGVRGTAFAGVGAALELSAWGQERFAQIDRQARELFSEAYVEGAVQPRLFGGFAFRDDGIPDNAWADFPPAHFVLPHYLLTRQGSASYLTLNVQAPPEEDPRALLPELRAALQTKIASLDVCPPAEPFAPAPLELRYPLDQAAWRAMIDEATQRIANGELKKVVLSRVAEISYAQTVDVDSALAYLDAAYPMTIRFLYEPRPHHAFFGATPELLVEQQRDRLRTMALAGSRRRGQDAEDDARQAQALLDDPKEREEHRLVIDALCAKLAPRMARLHIGQTQVMALPNIQHLYTPLEGELLRPERLLSWVELLHPTPALGGEPRDAAMNLIKALEAAPRGWYAAPIGWIDADGSGQFSVAIRSAVAQDRRVWLYAGCGVVAASDAAREWDETALKFRPMLAALGAKEAIHHG